jgi:helicase
MDDIGIVVADEFHLLQEPSRGPTLEILLSRIRHRVEGAQILALSATVGNADELAEWLEADLVKSEWRPIALYSGTLTGLDLRYHSVESPGGDFSIPESKRLDGGVNKNLHSVLDDTTDMDKQMLVFVASRSSAQKEARELSKHVKSKLDSGNHGFSGSITDSWNEMANSLISEKSH